MIDFNSARLTIEGIKKYYELAKEYPFKFAILTRPQAEIAKAIGTLVPQKRVFLATSGNGSGKTAFAINLVVNIVYGNVNIYRNIRDLDDGTVFSGFFDYPLFNHFPGHWPPRIWYVSNAESLKSIWEEFQYWLPEKMYTASKDKKGYISVVRFKGTPWKLFFKTIDQDIKTFESANVSVIIGDEPLPEPIFKRVMVRLRKGGFLYMPATPLFGAGYFADLIEQSLDPQSDRWHQNVSVWTNCIERAGKWDLGPFGEQYKGNLREADILAGLRSLDPDERKASEEGALMYYAGAVYKNYDRRVHFVDIKPVENPKHYVYQFVLDPHDRRPPAAIWIRVDRWGRKRVIREWPSVEDEIYNHLMFHQIKSAAQLVRKDFVRYFIQIFRELGIEPKRVQAIIDPNFGRKPNDRTGMMLYEEYEMEFREQGFPIHFVTNINDDLETRHQVVRDMLKEDVNGDYPLLIDKSCLNVDYAMRHYSYEDWEGKMAEKRGIREGAVRDKYKDFADLIGYACMCPIEWRPYGREEFRYDQDDYEEEEVDWAVRLAKIRPAGI